MKQNNFSSSYFNIPDAVVAANHSICLL